MRLFRTNIAKFAGFFGVFFALVFCVFFAFSEKSQTKASFYDSSSIKNQEVTLPDDFASLPDASGSVVSAQTHSQTGTLASAPELEQTGSTVSVTHTQNLPKFTFRFRPDSLQSDSKYAKYLEEILSASVFSDKMPALSVVLDAGMSDPRGKLVGKELSLSQNIANESEFIKVLVHEMGHAVDIHYLVWGTFTEDPSEKFYAISWQDYEHKKSGATLSNFVSGYALSNKYEDFAETFAFYVFHNSDFKKLSEEDEVLKEKYDFFQNYVFKKGEFQGTSFESSQIPVYSWDTTKISIDTKKYLFYLE